MLTLREISTADAEYGFVEKLWLQAFPENERRNIDAQRRNTDQCAAFNCLCAVDDGSLVGFITCWTIDDFCYVEHFATDVSARNRGYGGRIMALLQERMGGKPVVLEVEMPEDEMSRRRIGFYARQGFLLWEDHDYMQPPYCAGDAPLPMRLMAWGALNQDTDFTRVKNAIYSAVYGVRA